MLLSQRMVRMMMRAFKIFTTASVGRGGWCGGWLGRVCWWMGVGGWLDMALKPSCGPSKDMRSAEVLVRFSSVSLMFPAASQTMARIAILVEQWSSTGCQEVSIWNRFTMSTCN